MTSTPLYMVRQRDHAEDVGAEVVAGDDVGQVPEPVTFDAVAWLFERTEVVTVLWFAPAEISTPFPVFARLLPSWSMIVTPLASVPMSSALIVS